MFLVLKNKFQDVELSQELDVKIYHFQQSIPTTACSIGFAVGQFIPIAHPEVSEVWLCFFFFNLESLRTFLIRFARTLSNDTNFYDYFIEKSVSSVNRKSIEWIKFSWECTFKKLTWFLIVWFIQFLTNVARCIITIRKNNSLYIFWNIFEILLYQSSSVGYFPGKFFQIYDFFGN